MKACIIGGGIAGVALSRNLAKAGVAVTVIERGPQLCSGATWHAAGLVTRFAGSPKLKKVTVLLSSLNIYGPTFQIRIHQFAKHVFERTDMGFVQKTMSARACPFLSTSLSCVH